MWRHPACRIALALLPFMMCLGFLVLPSRVANAQDVRRQAIKEGKRLLDRGLYDQALSAYGRSGDSMGSELLDQVAAAQRKGDTARALELYDAYFHYFPFGSLAWHHQWRRWGQTAIQYVELLRKSKPVLKEGEETQNAAAVEVYRELMKHHEKYNEERCEKLADTIVEKYPLSMFCPAAVLSIGNVIEQRRCDGRAGIPVYERRLKVMRNAGCPDRSVILVMLAYADVCTNYSNPPKTCRKGVEAYEQVLRTTDVSYEGRLARIGAAKSALKARDTESLELGRRLFREFLAKYPTVPEAGEARMGVVRSFLLADQLDGALSALRELEKRSAEGTDFGSELLAIGKAHFGKKDYKKSLLFLEEIVRRFPRGASASLAYIGMGETYEKMGDEANMVAAYKKAAQAPSVNTATNIMDASNTRNRAIQFLGKHYMAKKQWAEALKYWERWHPTSWCGTCAESMKTEREKNIELCKKMIREAGADK